MKKLSRIVILSLVALFGATTSADAQFVQFKDWLVCGGNAFNTCAAVQVGIGAADATGVQHVTVRIWNLSGQLNSTWSNTVFTRIGWDNITAPAPQLVGSAITDMNGPVRGGGNPDIWVIDNGPTRGGGVVLDFQIADNGNNSSVNNGIASACGDPALFPGGNNNLWMNPCAADPFALPAANPDPLSETGWIVIEFDITGYWDLAVSTIYLKGQNGPNGMSTQCIEGQNCSIVPEPFTITLLGTGLFGLAGAGAAGRRRRRKEEEDEAAELA